MCGIVGMILPPTQLIDEATLGNMREKITHREPDEWGHYVNENIGLASVRLSIIDLANGRMPIYYDDQTKVIIYNGEIYNHDEIREELKKNGYQFKTRTDTEVVLKAYEEYGEECAGKFNGMFAFAIWDTIKKELFMARDQLGQKPFYFSYYQGKFIFASEIKSILKYQNFPRVVSKTGLYSYLQLGYVLPPYSMFEHVRKLPPGYSMKYQNGKYKMKQYWSIEYHPCHDLSLSQTTDLLREKTIKAVESRMISDVDISMFLSGGIDSTVIAGIVTKVLGRKIDSFTFGFTEKTGGDDLKFNNDIRHGAIVAKILGTNHNEHLIDLGPEELKQLISDIHLFMDEPCYAPALVPLYCLSRFIGESHKVSLTGDGGDELFAGYEMYEIENRISVYNYIPHTIRTALQQKFSASKFCPKKLKILINRGASNSESERYLSWKHIFDSEQFKEVTNQNEKDERFQKEFESYFSERSHKNYTAALTNADIKIWLSSHAQNSFDKMSMASSLETRSGFLDHELVEFSQRIPIQYKLKGNVTKWILKEAFKDVIPENVIKRQTGSMLSPSSTWLRNHLKPMVNDLLSLDNMKTAGLVNPEISRSIIDGHINKEVYAMIPTWSLFSLHLWHRLFIEDNAF